MGVGVLFFTVLALAALLTVAFAAGAWRVRPTALGLAVAAITFGLDQTSKLAVLYGLDLEGSGPLRVLPFLDLALVWNRGISYGLFAQEGALGRFVLIALAVAAGAALLVWITRVRSALLAASLGLVLGGAAGNALDRAVHGAVVDFVHVHWAVIGFSWYVFNVADAAIVVGVVGLLIDSLRPSRSVAANEPSD